MRRSQAERRDESQRRLLTATADVVAADGVAAATFDAIGRAAGYSRGLATQRFGSKQGLIEALIAALHDQQDEMLLAHHLDEHRGLDALLEYVDLYLSHLGDGTGARAYFMLLAGAVADANEQRALFAGSHRAVQGRLAGLIRRGQAAGDIRTDLDPDTAALMVGATLLGASIQWLTDPDTDLDGIRRTSLTTLRRAFAPDELPLSGAPSRRTPDGEGGS